MTTACAGYQVYAGQAGQAANLPHQAVTYSLRPLTRIHLLLTG